MIAQKTRYALRSLLFLAEEQGGAPVQLGRIAETQRVPPKYLELIMLDLKKAGLVKSARGPKGGYQLARSAEQISFGEIVRSMEGPDRARVLRQRQFLRAVRRLPGRGDVRDPPRLHRPARSEHGGARWHFTGRRRRLGRAAGGWRNRGKLEWTERSVQPAAGRRLVHHRRRGIARCSWCSAASAT